MAEGYNLYLGVGSRDAIDWTTPVAHFAAGAAAGDLRPGREAEIAMMTRETAAQLLAWAMVAAIAAMMSWLMFGCGPAEPGDPAPPGKPACVSYPLESLLDDAECVIERIVATPGVWYFDLEGVSGDWSLHVKRRPDGAWVDDVFQESGPDLVGLLNECEAWLREAE